MSITFWERFDEPQQMAKRKKHNKPTRQQLIGAAANKLGLTYTQASKNAAVRRNLEALKRGKPEVLTNKRQFNQKKKWEEAMAFFAQTKKDERFWLRIMAKDSEVTYL